MGSAIVSLEHQGLVLRTRAAGERADRVSFHPEAAVRGLESWEEYGEIRIFVLLFRYVFGGAIDTGAISYVDYLIPASSS